MITETIKTALRTNDNGNNIHKAQVKDCPMKRHEKEVRSEKTMRARIYLYKTISICPRTTTTPPHEVVCKKSRSGKQNNQIIEMEQV